MRMFIINLLAIIGMTQCQTLQKTTILPSKYDVIIDGVYFTGEVEAINPATVKSITILKPGRWGSCYASKDIVLIIETQN